MSLGRRSLLTMLAFLLSAPALAKVKPHPHPQTRPAPLVRKPVRSIGTAHAKPTVRPGHPTNPSKIAGLKRHPVNLPLIVIDAGHGGLDPGAVGRGGTLEKDVTLATALELGHQLHATRRYRVLFTRNHDVFKPLAARLQMIARSGAALMISIHADSASSRKVRGASVYVRSSGPGSRTKQFPAHRGAAPAIADALVKPPPESELLQYMMVGRLNDELRMTTSPARRAQLYVLAATNVPGVLLEMGYISNPKDEMLLRDRRHRAATARAVRDAVDQYFGNAHGTLRTAVLSGKHEL